MSLLTVAAKAYASYTALKVRKRNLNSAFCQQKIFRQLIETGSSTSFGKEHGMNSLMSYEDFKENIPVRDYEGIKKYVDRIISEESDVLWKGKPLYLSKTSGTTSGIKYIPITKVSLPNHIGTTREALAMYVHETGRTDFLRGKLIFLSGSPELDFKDGIPTGRLSGIVNHHIPGYLKKNQLPTYETNCIEDWEEKIEKICDETAGQNMSLISGIPPWVQMYFDKIIQRTGKKVKDVFPDFSLFVYGGVNYEPYRSRLEETIGKKVDSLELYPASEGFIAYQDSQTRNDLLLNTDSGIFYEFIPMSEYFDPNAKRIPLSEVEAGINYAIILSSNAGLWAYSLGDTVKFTSVNPYRILITGRISQFISAFGEHVIAEEVEHTLQKVISEFHADVVEFTVAPQVNPPTGELPYHEWFIEFSRMPDNMEKFSFALDVHLQQKNIYYKDLVKGNIIQPLKIHSLEKDSFIRFMKSNGKLGGQNKVPRLSNDRKIADGLTKYCLIQ
ncbi:MAG: GH3 auxin-responsive promoter family protein [Bacteroidia bacterium]|nr:GH3 auxin-responsive promoter family protein [Bacteroidia bacterium]